MMAGPRKRWKPLQLLIISSLLILTNQIEARQDVQEKLSREPTGLHRLIPDQLLLHNEKDLDAFLVHFDQQTMEDWLQSVSEISPSFRQDVLVLTGNTNSSDDKMRQESSLAPQQRVPVSMKVLSNQSCRSESDSNTEGETGSQNPQTGSGFSGSSQRPDDPIIEFDHQQILMLEDDEVVRTAAASLYEKHPTVSSLYAVDPQQRVQRVKGQPGLLSEHSSLVLVGHGARDHSGEMRISGYSSKDVARIIQSSSRTSQKIQTTTVVACDVGSDQRFREALLKKLHEAGMETELHLWTAVVQVAETGEVLSQDGAQWRSEDHTKKVVLTVGRNGEIRTRKDDHHRGHIVLTNRRNILQNLFIDPEIYKKVDQNKVEELTKDFRILEAFTWGLFHQEPAEEPQRVDVNNLQNEINNYVIGAKTANEIQGKTEEEKIRQVLQRCYVIGGGRDIRKIIRHYAVKGENGPTFLMVNKWIFRVDPKSLYVTPAGKHVLNQQERQDVVQLINNQDKEGSESYTSLRSQIFGNNEKNSYGYFIRQILLGELVPKPHETDFFFSTWYFTASNIIESVRNFRTFTLVLMALNMDEKFTVGRPDFWFNQHSMARGGSWIDENSRGFSGSAAPSIGRLTEAQLNEVVKLLKLEHLVLKKWQESLGGANKLKEVVKIAVHYGVLNKSEVKKFTDDSLDFMNNAKPQAGETPC